MKPRFIETLHGKYKTSRYASEKGAMRLLSGVDIPDEWAKYSTQANTDFEIVHRPIWDTQSFTTASTTLLNFFAAAQANTGLGNENFPLKNSFLCAAIGLYFKTTATNDTQGAAASTFTSSFTDKLLITNTGVLNITIGQKLYGPFPLWKLSAGAGIWGLVGSSGTPTSAVNYGQVGMPTPESMFKLAIPLVLPMNTQVYMTMSWAATVAIDISPATLCLILDGKEARPLQ